MYSSDGVIFLYILNAIMVSTDITLYYRNQRLMRKQRDRGRFSVTLFYYFIWNYWKGNYLYNEIPLRFDVFENYL